MEKLTALIIAGVITEGVTEVLKQLKKDGKINSTMLISIIVGIGVAVTAQLDILGIMGFETIVPYFGIIITGLLISRGSNYISDLVTKLTSVGNVETHEINHVAYDEDIQEEVEVEDLDSILEELDDMAS